ncbi:unnamed protein product [Protopolystoma xenopodis]|uniref:Uncharacterized protein n=1 Tax=Protopolystoma xenopodis TaxID=117903 RepID=A0A448WDW8_9PLAT|nr:unnamed protein product [Protopolystoma xenopodis]
MCEDIAGAPLLLPESLVDLDTCSRATAALSSGLVKLCRSLAPAFQANTILCGIALYALGRIAATLACVGHCMYAFMHRDVGQAGDFMPLSVIASIFPPVCGLITPAIHPDLLFRSANPTRASNPDSLHGPVDPFLIFLVDRFHSVPVPVCVSLQPPFLKALEGSDCHACRYPAFPSRVLSFIKPMLSEQTVDVYLWSHATSQVDFYYI